MPCCPSAGLTSWCSWYDKEYADLDAFTRAEIDLRLLGLDKVDLMLLHWPCDDFEDSVTAYKAMEPYVKSGKVRAIGVSNFQKADLDNLIEHATVKPMINQILAHIGNTPFELIDHAKSQGMLVEAYSPIAHGKILDNAEIGAMAEKYDVSIPQLCIRYILQLDLLALPKTANPKHMKINADVDFEIAAEDMETLKAITAKDYGDASVFPVYSGKV